MSSIPCQICGCTDLNLVDGFYYCVECGTQDTTLRETIVEKTIYCDYGEQKGTDVKRYSTVLKDAFQMSGEWCKWHAYNFILAALADELLAVGAKPTVKMKVQWIWLRYIKKYQTKDEPEATMFENKTSNEQEEKKSTKDDTDDEYDSESDEGERKNKVGYHKADITKITVSLFVAILYTALNLDSSDIQLSHLYQYIREGRLSIPDCYKFIPKEIPFKLIPNRKQFESSVYIPSGGNITPIQTRALSFELIKQLDLGVPLVPDLNKIIDNFITELCLPNDFKDLVLSLTRSMPCDFLEVDDECMKRPVCIPDYEAFCMAYILLALKMCFGLDCDYENKLSDAVDEINSERDYLKSYKLGMHSEPTNRLFSFREWCMFLQCRKMILCKYYLPLARQYNFPADNAVFMEHSNPRKTQIMKLSYDVAMDILNKIPTDDARVIPKKEFHATVTPLTTYTDVIREHIDDVELKLRLCEDFTQYSLKYATRDLKFPECETNNEGVNKINKTVNTHLIVGNYVQNTGNTKVVVVRNCDNKNWLTTKPPKVKHITKIKSDSEDDCSSELASETETNETWSDIDTDSSDFSEMTSDSDTDESGSDDDDNDSLSELSQTETDESGLLEEDSEHESEEETEEICDVVGPNEETEEKCDIIEEEDEELCIFDDDFGNLKIKTEIEKKIDREETDDNVFNFETNMDASKTERHENNIDVHDSYINEYDSKIDIHDTFSETSFPERVPTTFDRQKLIEELIEIACKKYKISVPKQKDNERPVKRKNFENSEAGVSAPKRKRSIDRTKAGEAKKQTQGLLTAYYENIHNDVLLQISEQVRNAIETAQTQAECNIADDALRNITDDTLNNQTEEIDAQNQNDVNGDLQNDTNVVDDDQTASLHDGSTQDDTANSAIDDGDAEFNIEELLPKIEPNFDPRTHDIEQLYVKFKDEFDDFDFSKIDNDPDISDIIEKKIAEFRDFNENDKPQHQNDTGKDKTSESNESDTDITSKRDKLKQKSYMRATSEEYLVLNRKIKMFGYWLKTYSSRNYIDRRRLTHKFDIELGENTPKSFFFVINECAAISNSSNFSLYKKLNAWENRILNKDCGTLMDRFI
ncbi:uncharacterized protein LOC123877780 isoform X2 [Maniola jurtina]|uniref:uncharacterized protein LOC123877780 isoform X2 n=1 Tax=Maniola jurtina TaxID=191418 RepID=UPI001E687D93|nr:uncharacterized protein LOC123877780 isoform X2 [Maniola jurtina]